MQERCAGVSGRAIAPGAALAASAADHGGLKSLAGESVADRYCAWRGESEQRYVASIFPVDAAAADGGLPAFDGFVLIAVTRDGAGRRILFARAIERAADARSAVARGLAEGASEWHVHFLAEMPSGRAAIVNDLSLRHLTRPGPHPAGSSQPRPALSLLRLAS